jgi:hypothetical protein
VSQFPGGGPDFIIPGRPGYKAQKSRGAYLQWLDDNIRVAKLDAEVEGRGGEFYLSALQDARKAFTDEFYPK